MGPQRHSSPNTFLLGTRLPRTTVGSLPTQFKGRALATVHSRPASRNQHATHVGQSGPPELWLRDERCPHRGTRQGARLRLTSSPQGHMCTVEKGGWIPNVHSHVKLRRCWSRTCGWPAGFRTSHCLSHGILSTGPILRPADGTALGFGSSGGRGGSQR